MEKVLIGHPMMPFEGADWRKVGNHKTTFQALTFWLFFALFTALTVTIAQERTLIRSWFFFNSPND